MNKAIFIPVDTLIEIPTRILVGLDAWPDKKCEMRRVTNDREVIKPIFGEEYELHFACNDTCPFTTYTHWFGVDRVENVYQLPDSIGRVYDVAERAMNTTGSIELVSFSMAIDKKVDELWWLKIS